ncbi:MAG: DDE-type integrase/transposase/recombinase [Actinobacteria bacterium]|nr:DDE-type integrase/transposase/recombinase [Actinomycetota bacterium]
MPFGSLFAVLTLAEVCQSTRLAIVSGIAHSEISRIETGAANPTYASMRAGPAARSRERWLVEWTEAGALLHIDGFELPTLSVAGHWATGQRGEEHKTRGAGKTVVIGVIDDHTRLAYCELLCAENAITVSAILRRAAAWFVEQGCGPVQAVMSDNAKCYSTSFAFRDTLAQLDARQILIPPATPR